MITINLPSYGYRETYDRSRFLEMFPDSLIATTFTDPSETEVDLVNPLVTPYVLGYIQELLMNNIPSPPREDLTLASRYLLMPILGVISDPQYSDFHSTFPLVNLMDMKSVQDSYDYILIYVAQHNYMSLLMYVWDLRVQPIYANTNLEALIISANHGYLPMVQFLYPHIKFPEAWVDFDELDDLIYDRTAVGEYLADTVSRIGVIQAAALGDANSVLTYLSTKLAEQVDAWNQALEIAVRMNNYEGIDITRSLANPGLIPEIVQEEADNGRVETVRHLFLPIGIPITNDNILIQAMDPYNDDVFHMMLRIMTPQDILRVLRDHLDKLRSDIIQALTNSWSKTSPNLAKDLYTLLKDNDYLIYLPEFESHIDPSRIWLDVMSRIPPSVLEALLVSPDLEVPDPDYLLELAEILDRDDLIPILQAHMDLSDE